MVAAVLQSVPGLCRRTTRLRQASMVSPDVRLGRAGPCARRPSAARFGEPAHTRDAPMDVLGDHAIGSTGARIRPVARPEWLRRPAHHHPFTTASIGACRHVRLIPFLRPRFARLIAVQARGISPPRQPR